MRNFFKKDMYCGTEGADERSFSFVSHWNVVEMLYYTFDLYIVRVFGIFGVIKSYNLTEHIII